MTMTREEFENKSFEEIMNELCCEVDCITTIDVLKSFIQKLIDEDDFELPVHLLNAIWNDPNTGDDYWWDYDYSMGTLDIPVNVCDKEDIEHLIDFED